MTEEKWLGTNSHVPLWAVLKTTSNRKLRLLACACCRSIWHLILDPRSQQAVATAELYADGHVARRELHARELLASAAREDFVGSLPDGTDFAHDPRHSALWAVECAARINKKWTRWATDSVVGAQCLERPDAEPTSFVEGPSTADLARDIFGNPFRPVEIDPRWLTSNVVDLSRFIYDERAFDRMPILADALMDAGCDSEEIIHHCRGDGPHVRGCWVVDLLLGKE